MTVKLDDRRFRAKLNAEIVRSVKKASEDMRGYIRQKIGVSARAETPGSRRTRVRNAKAKGRAFAAHRYQASAPGEPPRKRTGTLQKSIAYEVKGEGDTVVARIGTPVDYGRFLEFGTKRMAARPYLASSLAERRDRFFAVIRTDLRRKFPNP